MDSKVVVAKVGAVAGWAALLGILLFDVIGPMIVAGQRVSGTLDASLVRSYYTNSALQYFTPAVFVTAAVFLVLGVALYEVLGVTEQARFLARLGLAFVIIEVPLIITKSALMATLVSVASSEATIVPLFRFWDVLYNSGIYMVEAGVVLSFGLAMSHVKAFPRWVTGLSLVAAALQLVNMFALFVGIPDSATIVGNLAFVAWFIEANVGLSKIAWQPRQALVV